MCKISQKKSKIVFLPLRNYSKILSADSVVRTSKTFATVEQLRRNNK